MGISTHTTSVTVLRRFPTYDFELRTTAPADLVLQLLSRAMDEPPAASWPFPKAQFTGSVVGNTFSCRPRTSVLGGNAVPSVSGAFTSAPAGGTHVTVRVIEWFVYVMVAFVIAVTALLASRTTSTPELLKVAATSTWLFIVATAIYFGEVAFVRKILLRILRGETVAA